jgi:hypothetical protein
MNVLSDRDDFVPHEGKGGSTVMQQVLVVANISYFRLQAYATVMISLVRLRTFIRSICKPSMKRRKGPTQGRNASINPNAINDLSSSAGCVLRTHRLTA